jgi:subtilisin family serine protease
MRTLSFARNTTIVLILVAAGIGHGQVVLPPSPATYRAQLRYRILLPPIERVPRFERLVKFLESIGFHKDPGPITEAEDASETHMSGTIPSANAHLILAEPAVFSVVVEPADWQRPGDPATLVGVRIDLARGLPRDRQQLLAEQTRERLILLGFQEAIGYDHRGHTLLVGKIPVGELATLLGDIREIPAGWLTPIVAIDQLPPPIRDVSPIRFVEVTPEPTGFESRAAAIPLPVEIDVGGLWKIDPGLRALAQGSERVPTSFEVILRNEPDPFDLSWQQALQKSAPGVIVEGRLGLIVACKGPPAAAPVLATLPYVSGVRLPHAASAPRVGDHAFDPAAVLEATGLAVWRARGATGRGVRIAVIDSDFRGQEALAGPQIHYVDFTTLRNADLKPEPFPGESSAIGHGTACARTVLEAAPEADITLVRIDPAGPYQLLEAARLITGELLQSAGVALRRAELAAARQDLEIKQNEVIRRRQTYLENFGEEEANIRHAGRPRESSQLEREREERLAKINQDEKEVVELRRSFLDRQTRLGQLEDDFHSLRGIPIVVNALVWSQGYPVSASALDRFLEGAGARRMAWFQAAGDSRGQTWAGLFRDADDNGFMDFAPPQFPLPVGRWTPELNFVGWQVGSAAPTPDLPAGATMRIGLQWREAHDPEFSQDAGDPYRLPLARLSVLLLRQRDPTGTHLPTDALEVVGRSTAVPQRLVNEADAATYWQEFDVKLPVTGRYAIRIEGRVPRGDRPPGSASIPAIERNWELYPRISLNAMTPASGRPVFLDYVHDYGSLGMPADSAGAMTVGAASLDGRPDLRSSRGAPLGRQLMRKPNLYGPLSVDVGAGSAPFVGSSVAASYVAGVAAALLSAGLPPQTVERILTRRPTSLLHLPQPPPEIQNPKPQVQK